MSNKLDRKVEATVAKFKILSRHQSKGTKVNHEKSAKKFGVMNVG
jgi:hypothetical protein